MKQFTCKSSICQMPSQVTALEQFVDTFSLQPDVAELQLWIYMLNEEMVRRNTNILGEVV